MSVLLKSMVLFLFATIAIPVCAQKIQINEDAVVSDMMTRWVDQNRTKPYIAGWRVQLISSTDRRQVESGKTRFMEIFPDIHADWVQEKPYYKLRAGAFFTKAEAMMLVTELNNAFTGAYPTADAKIHPREFLE